MASKGLKKIGGKRKQNGKKGPKSRTADIKPKHEMEIGSKDQISELEKEIFSIKINEMEGKLARKKQLCAFLEEERSLYIALYEEKKLIKKESMKLLNNTYEDFATEILLLEHELHAMGCNFEKMLESKEFCTDEKESVKRLSNLELKLEKKLFEAGRSSEEIIMLSSKLTDLQMLVCEKDEQFKNNCTSLRVEYEMFTNRMQEELSCIVDKIIEDRNLKLNLLPVPYQALFISGMVGASWLESTLEYSEHLLSQNTEIEKTILEFQLMRESIEENIQKYLFEICVSLQVKQYIQEFGSSFSSSVNLPNEVIKFEPVDNTESHLNYLLQLKNMNFALEGKIKDMKLEIKKLEKSILYRERLDEQQVQDSRLVEIITIAGNIIKQEIS